MGYHALLQWNFLTQYGTHESWIASLVTQLVKNPPAVQEILVQILDQEDKLEKG